jgi:hypothetical protein
MYCLLDLQEGLVLGEILLSRRKYKFINPEEIVNFLLGYLCPLESIHITSASCIFRDKNVLPGLDLEILDFDPGRSEQLVHEF